MYHSLIVMLTADITNSSWKRRMSPNTRGIDDDDDPYSEPDETLKPYLKLERNQDQVRNNVDQSNEHSWLLSSESSAER